MKLLVCDICNEAFAAETFEEWLQLIMPHYMEVHADIMEASKNNSKQDQDDWMSKNRARFEAAEEI